MRFEITRTSLMVIEGVEDAEDAARIMGALSQDTEGRSMVFDGRPITYVTHVRTTALRIDDCAVERNRR